MPAAPNGTRRRAATRQIAAGASKTAAPAGAELALFESDTHTTPPSAGWCECLIVIPLCESKFGVRLSAVVGRMSVSDQPLGQDHESRERGP